MGPPPGLLAVSFLQSIAANIGKRRAKSVKPLLLFSRKCVSQGRPCRPWWRSAEPTGLVRTLSGLLSAPPDGRSEGLRV